MLSVFACNRTKSELSPWMKVVVLLRATLLAFSVTASTNVFQKSPKDVSSLYQVDEFKPNGTVTLRHMVLDLDTGRVYVGAVNYIYSLDPDLKLNVSVQTGPIDDNGNCPPPSIIHAACKFEKRPTDNVNKVLVIDKSRGRLITCGTIYHGYCERRDLSNISKIDLPLHYEYSVVSNNAQTSTVAFVSPGPEDTGSVLYISVSYSEEQFEYMDVPAFASRKLTDFSLAKISYHRFTETSFRIDSFQKQRFPIFYVYGFGSQNFSYMMAVQKVSPTKRKLHSVIFRVCQNDTEFNSYVEVALECTLSGTSYNVLKAATLGKASVHLATQLGIDSSRDVLYGVFAKQKSFSDKPTSEGVMCIFPMNRVRSKFTENILRCFKGTGNTGGGHLGQSRPCIKNMEYIIDDNYCGETDSNQPLAGLLPIKSEAVLEFPPSTGVITALNVTIVGDYTVAFVGTGDGNIVKVSLDSPISANVYERVAISPGKSILQDLRFDKEAKNLYVMTDSKVVKMKVEDCTQYNTCENCLAARDPYCGWCTLENKCSRIASCFESKLPKRWLPYDSLECPAIKSVKPLSIPTVNKTLMTLNVQNLPDFSDPMTYNCSFTPVGRPNFMPLTTDAELNGSILQCDTPPIAALPRFEKDSDYVEMKLSVLIGKEELVYKTITFFNCNIHTSCTSCTQSQFSCFWCVKNHRCTQSPSNYCRNDDLITSKPDPDKPSASLGPEFCPQYKNQIVGSEILVPAGSLYKVKVTGISLFDFQLNSLKCKFNIDEIKFVRAVATPTQGKTYEIVCDAVLFNYENRNLDSQNVTFNIIWGEADNPLDNPADVLVVVYTCRIMAKTCGECLIAHPKYKCSWCDKGASSCTTTEYCLSSPGNLLIRGNVCPNASISKFSPHSGPMEGGTLITIIGNNLGFNITDIQVNIDAGVCEVVSIKAPKRIVCKTNKAKVRGQTGEVVVIVGKKEKAVSSQSFSFVESKVFDIFPTTGPLAGGTMVTLIGENLNAGSNVFVEIGHGNPCLQPRSVNAGTLTCQTSGRDNASSQTFDVYMKIDNTDLKKTGVQFSYVLNFNATMIPFLSATQSGSQIVTDSGIADEAPLTLIIGVLSVVIIFIIFVNSIIFVRKYINRNNSQREQPFDDELISRALSNPDERPIERDEGLVNSIYDRINENPHAQNVFPLLPVIPDYVQLQDVPEYLEPIHDSSSREVDTPVEGQREQPLDDELISRALINPDNRPIERDEGFVNSIYDRINENPHAQKVFPLLPVIPDYVQLKDVPEYLETIHDSSSREVDTAVEGQREQPLDDELISRALRNLDERPIDRDEGLVNSIYDRINENPHAQNVFPLLPVIPDYVQLKDVPEYLESIHDSSSREVDTAVEGQREQPFDDELKLRALQHPDYRAVERGVRPATSIYARIIENPQAQNGFPLLPVIPDDVQLEDVCDNVELIPDSPNRDVDSPVEGLYSVTKSQYYRNRMLPPLPCEAVRRTSQESFLVVDNPTRSTSSV